MRNARQILQDATTIAVVGASADRYSQANWCPRQMQDQGWRIVPVNPHADQLFGEHSYARLSDIPDAVDIVDVFDTSDDAASIVRGAIDIGARAVWLEPDLVSPEGRRLATEAGLDYVEDDCVALERALGCLRCHDKLPPSKVYVGLVPV